MATHNLSEAEVFFCDLYASGEAPFGGNATRCYKEAFHDNSTRCKRRALELLAREDIQSYLKEIEALGYEEQKYIKIFLSENLKSIIEECATAEYRNRKGALMSPAALRSVAVNASRTLMELHGVKEASVSKLSIDGAGEGGITFNVIMPDTAKKDEGVS